MKNIRTALIRLARRVGTWLLRRFAEWVTGRLLRYMRARVDDWEHRGVRPGARRRWKAAIAWIEKHSRRLAKCGAQELVALAVDQERRGVPVNACDEVLG